jgi:hypothetical protein
MLLNAVREPAFYNTPVCCKTLSPIEILLLLVCELVDIHEPIIDTRLIFVRHLCPDPVAQLQITPQETPLLI